MASRFKESLGFVKKMRVEVQYHCKNECEFCKRYVEDSTNCVNEELIIDHDKFVLEYPFLPNPFYNGFYSDLYAAFTFIYEIETTLDLIEYNGMNLQETESLLEQCELLAVTSTNAMIGIDDDFSFANKYSLAQDIYTMAKNMYNLMLLAHTEAEENIPNGETITLTDYDDIYGRLCCKYIRNGISVLKLFHLFALLQASPIYPDDVHVVAKKIIGILREVLYDKRVIRLVVDSDLYGSTPKPHKSTRLKIYFAMGNSDRYCIRLDFPHQGEDSIHLNINEPARKQSTGFPFNGELYEEAIKICGDKTVFDSLFYYRDDLYWFRSDFTARIKNFRKSCNEKTQALEQFQHNRAHIEVFPSSKDNRMAVSCFSEAFAEAMADYEDTCIYGQTDTDDEEFYKYVLFQDYIFDTVIRVRSYEMQINLDCYESQQRKSVTELESNLKLMFCEYIKEHFPLDENSVGILNQQMDFREFLSCLLDYMEKKGL